MVSAMLTSLLPLALFAAVSTAPDPSFLVIVLDDVGYYDLVEDETIATPAMDSIASVSARFTRAYVTAPMCSPSRTCITGEYGRRHGIGRIIRTNESNDLDPTPTLATRLRSAGWKTCLVGKWHLSSGKNYSLANAPSFFGFDNWRAVATHNIPDYFTWQRVDDGVTTLSTEYATAAQAEAAVDWWGSTPGAKFLWLSFSAVHTPLQTPPAPYYQGPPPVNARQRMEAMLEAVDNRVGFMLESMDLSNTYVVLWSDNGANNGSSEAPQQIFKLKRTLYEGGIRTPLYFMGPGIAPGDRTELVSTVDFYQTVLDLADLGGGTVDSLSFAGALGGVQTTQMRQWIFAERFTPNFDWVAGPPAKWPSRERTIRRADGWKLIVEEKNGKVNKRQLFDLNEDPEERRPSQNHRVEAQLLTLLDQFP